MPQIVGFSQPVADPDERMSIYVQDRREAAKNRNEVGEIARGRCLDRFRHRAERRRAARRTANRLYHQDSSGSLLDESPFPSTCTSMADIKVMER